MLPRSIAILTARESSTALFDTIQAAAISTADAESLIDVLVNGNTNLAREITAKLGASNWPDITKITIRVWHINFPDKAATYNKYFQDIWPGSDICFFIDGYARVMPDAIPLLDQALHEKTEALGGTGVPTKGRSAKKLRETMLSKGGIHGNFFAIKGSTLQRIRKQGIHIPVGGYRNDPTLGAMLCFNLDPANYDWNSSRIYVHPDATWKIDEGSPWRWKDLKAELKRRNRQGIGLLMVRAVRDHLAIRKQPPETMPETAAELITSWVARNPRQALGVFLRRPQAIWGLNKLKKPRDWSGLADTPKLLATIGGGSRVTVHPLPTSHRETVANP